MELHHGDCLDIMPQLDKVDAIITDPPYNVSKKGSVIKRGKGAAFQGGDINMDFGDWDYGSVTWEDYIDVFVELLTDVGVLVMFYDKLYLGSIGLYLQEEYDFQVRHIGSMIKRNPAPQARKVKWQNGVENFLVATKNKGMGHHFNYHLGQSPDYMSSSNNYEHLHPTQKPLPVMEWIVRYWTHESDLVLDPFLGSGTTGVACIRTGRKFIGIEKEKKYFDIAKDRIEQASLQPLLFTEGKKAEQAEMF